MDRSKCFARSPNQAKTESHILVISAPYAPYNNLRSKPDFLLRVVQSATLNKKSDFDLSAKRCSIFHNYFHNYLCKAIFYWSVVTKVGLEDKLAPSGG